MVNARAMLHRSEYTNNNLCSECHETSRTTLCVYDYKARLCFNCIEDHYNIHMLAGVPLNVSTLDMLEQDLNWAREEIKGCSKELSTD